MKHVRRKTAALAAAIITALAIGLGGGFGIAYASASGPVYSQGTIVDLCVGIGGTVQDKVYAEAGKDAGIPGSCGANYAQLPVVADPDRIPIASGGSSTDVVTVTNPGNQANNTGSGITLALAATSSQAHPITSWSATGLPGGLAVNSSGVITGTITAAPGTFVVTVTATDSVATVGSVTFDWVVNS